MTTDGASATSAEPLNVIVILSAPVPRFGFFKLIERHNSANLDSLAFWTVNLCSSIRHILECSLTKSLAGCEDQSVGDAKAVTISFVYNE